MPISKLRPSFTLTEDRLKELQAVVPEAFADGRINWETLREALGETLEDETKEHFGLFWPGKREARRLAALPSKGTLIPQPGAGVDEDSTHNLFIEGDNLEVLKLLQKSYAGRVKMIYIDPPYNTGNDFVYPDDYSEPLEAYLERTGQVDEEGRLLTTNSRASGRFHSNWLNMIYPRLILARLLLHQNGLIFISIDDNEVDNLRLLANEIFGEENFIARLVWHNSSRVSDKVAVEHEYILVYAKDFGNLDRPWKKSRDEAIKLNQMIQKARTENKSIEEATLLLRKEIAKFLEKEEGSQERKYSWMTNYQNIDDSWRIYYAVDLSGEGDGPARKFGDKLIPAPAGRHWMSQEYIDELYAEDRIVWRGDRAYRKLFIEESEEGLKGIIQLPTRRGSEYLKQLLGKDIFTKPKPTDLIMHLMKYMSEQDDIVLDFFAGSCTTAQAVYELNREDQGKRQFIMIQLPEPTPTTSAAYRAKYKNISEIGKERIRRAIKELKPKNSKQLSLVNDDLGFKCYSLDLSSFKEWESYTGKDTSQLELRLSQAETPLVEGWTSENLFTEILLLQGFPLDSSVKALPEFKANEVKQVTSEFVGHHLYVCLDKKVKAETVAKLSLRAEDILVCLDSALSDEAKVNLADRCNLKVI